MLAEETFVGFLLSLEHILHCLGAECSSSATLRCGVASPCVCPSADRSSAAMPGHGSRSSQRHSSAAADVGCAWCSGTASICRSCGLLSTCLKYSFSCSSTLKPRKGHNLHRKRHLKPKTCRFHTCHIALLLILWVK